MYSFLLYTYCYGYYDKDFDITLKYYSNLLDDVKEKNIDQYNHFNKAMNILKSLYNCNGKNEFHYRLAPILLKEIDSIPIVLWFIANHINVDNCMEHVDDLASENKINSGQYKNSTDLLLLSYKLKKMSPLQMDFTVNIDITQEILDDITAVIREQEK